MGASIAQVTLNGTAMTPTNPLTGSNEADTGVWLGAQNNGNGQRWNGDIAELLIYDRTLSVSERNDVNVYLGNKWGIAVVPEPTTFAMLLVGAGALVLRRRRQS